MRFASYERSECFVAQRAASYRRSRCFILNDHANTPFEEYMDKEVAISKSDHFYGGVRGTSYDYIVKEDGEIFFVLEMKRTCGA